jgi:beta-lactamase class A
VLTFLLGLQTLDPNGDFEHIVESRPMRVGLAFVSDRGIGGVALNDRFSLQSVMKLIVGFAVLDAVDRGKLRLDERILIRRKDLSLNVQPIAALVEPKGYQTSVRDLIRRAIVDSDSAAIDILIRRLGGVKAVQSALLRKGVSGIRVDRDERHLQTEIVGLEWRPEFVAPKRLERAIANVPLQTRDAAYQRYLKDPRDTASPIAMARFLKNLADGKLLKPTTTRFLLDVMRQTRTGKDRMMAGLIRGYKLGHKTGTSNTWRGLTAATNDVGIVWAPDGRTIAIAAFVADSKAPAGENDQVIRQLTRTILDHHRQ